MLKVFKGRQVLVVGLVAMLLVAGYVKWAGDTAENVAVTTNADVESDGEAYKTSSTSVDGEGTEQRSSSVTLGNESAKDSGLQGQQPTLDVNENTDGAESGAGQNNSAKMPDTVAASANVSGKDYFIEAKLNKDIKRSEALEVLHTIIDNPETTVNAKEDAQNRVIETAVNIEKEGKVENLIKAKGFEDCIAYIDIEGVNITVKAEKLESSGAAQIQDIVMSQTNIKADKIKINTIK